MSIIKGDASWIDIVGLNERQSSEFFSNIHELDQAETSISQAHIIRRAWENMGLSGVLCLDGVPSIYFKEVNKIDSGQLRNLHQKLWNQGIAPALFVISETEVYVLSGLTLPARENEDIALQHRLVKVFDRIAEALEIRQFVRNFELGEIFRLYPNSFNPDNRVDRYLLDNLDATRVLLRKAASSKLDTQTVHALLGRLIFTCYLIDREIIGSKYLYDAGAANSKKLLDILSFDDTQKVKEILYNLFKLLQRDFNGDVFDGNLEAEKHLIESEHINILWRFFNGDKLDGEQVSLGFWAYDFSIIPIETISGIYESFLQVENTDANEKRNKGVFYTPRFLAEVVIDTALDGFNTLLGKRYLDPACGSGIFLVGIFNRMAEEWRRRNIEADNTERATALMDILIHSLFGIDENETACRITAFSLYLALLDQLSPRDIQELQKKGRKLPALVVQKRNPVKPDSGSNILPKDFFDEDLPLFAEENSYFPVDEFDLVIGNPPWVRQKNREKSIAERWCDKRGLIYPQRQIAGCFIWKALTHVKDDGQICFLLPATLLFGYSKILTFQKDWFSRCVIERIMNLADMGFYLFEDADHPTIVVKYRNKKPNLNKDNVQYLTPKTEMETLRAEMLVISPEDQKVVKMANVIRHLRNEEAPTIWKEIFWGTPRDHKFVQRLHEYETLKDWENRELDYWVVHEGYNRGGKGEPKYRPILEKIPFLNPGDVETYTVKKEKLHPCAPVLAPRVMSSESVFKAPHIVFPHGVDRKGKRLRVAFSMDDFSFSHALRGIHAPKEQESELRFLTCILASPLALYYLFHTTTNWAIERPDILVTEYRGFPFPKPNSGVKKEIIEKAAEIHKRLEESKNESFAFFKAPQEEIEEYIKQLDQLVFDYYEVDSWEEALIYDTVNMWIPSATPRRTDLDIKTLLPSNESSRQEYLKLILEALNLWTDKTAYSVSGVIIDSFDDGLGVVSLLLHDKNSLSKTNVKNELANHDLADVLNRINSLLHREMTSIRFMRNLKVFDGDYLHILKPLSNKYWTKTYALNDADEIATAIFTQKSI